MASHSSCYQHPEQICKTTGKHIIEEIPDGDPAHYEHKSEAYEPLPLILTGFEFLERCSRDRHQYPDQGSQSRDPCTNAHHEKCIMEPHNHISNGSPMNDR